MRMSLDRPSRSLLARVLREASWDAAHFDSLLVGSQKLASEALLAPLHEGRLILKDGQRLLQALNLCLTPRFSRLIRLRFSNAPVFDFRIVLENCAQFGAGGLLVRRKLCNFFV